ncbi:MAG TPA: ASKHA domain-containing protein [Gaiellaceae bacterium]|nr:ASKHA domain-containing protein [Gaiellaceae bacterium]
MSALEATGCRVDFEPIGRHGTCRPGESLFDVSRGLGIDLSSICGGQGKCGHCRVQVVEGVVDEPSTADREHLSREELGRGFRLACRTSPQSDCVLFVPPESLGSAMRSQVEGRETRAVVQPLVRAVELELTPPSLEHPLADGNAVLAGLRRSASLDAETVDVDVLRGLSPQLRDSGWRCTAVVREAEVVAIAPPGSRPLGLAFDLGTTGVAGYLLELGEGRVLAARGSMNPQIAFGEDVVSRIVHARKSAGSRDALRQAAVGGLNRLAEELCSEAGATPGDVVEAVVVGNTAMHHLLLGLPTEQLALSPFVPAVAEELNLKARDVGLALAPGAYVYLPPNIAAFVGADHVAMLLATADEWRGKCAIALDIGTNTEITLTLPDGKMRSVSCPSGPAFEGYHIGAGMRATEGAIEQIHIGAEWVSLQVIGGRPPVGICGSGIVDALGQLHLAGVLSPNGRIELDTHPRVREVDGRREFVLVPEDDATGQRAITVTQADVRETLLAKAAIQTGIDVLLADSGLDAVELETIVIAGAFGSYLDVANAVATGMLPPLPLDRFVQVGNAAGMGAKLALTSAGMRAQARELRERIDYIELAGYPRFSRRYADSCRLPRTRERTPA